MIQSLIVNADDFGVSHSVNQAVERAHREGILTSASLMAGGDAFQEAVEIARRNPRLGVGLHLTLVKGRPVSDAGRIPGLVDDRGCFGEDPVSAGARFFFDHRLRPQIKEELEAQFARVSATGLPLDHVNGHLNIHMHPTVLRMVLEMAKRWGVECMRLTRDSTRLSIECGPSGNSWPYRLAHALVFGALCARARVQLKSMKIRYPGRVFGLLQNGRVDEDYVCRLIPRLDGPESELYSHPYLDEFSCELKALTSPRVRELVDRFQVRLIRYSDLLA